MSAAHDTLFAAARVAFCAALSRAGIHYNALALDLEGAGLPRPSAGNARYRALILSLIRVGDEPWELVARIRAAFRADLHTGYDMPPAPPVEAAPAPHPRPAVLPPAGSAPVASVGKPISGAQIAWLKRLGAAPAPAAAAMVARMTPAQRSAAASLAARLMSIPEVRVAAGRLG